MAANWSDTERANAYARLIELRRTHTSFERIGPIMWEEGSWPRPGKKPPAMQTVHTRYREALRSIPAPQLTELRAERSEQLGQLARRAQEILDKTHYAHSNGHMVYDAKGVALVDDAPRLAAIRELRMISAQLTELNGEKVPVKQQVQVDAEVKFSVVGVDVEALK